MLGPARASAVQVARHLRTSPALSGSLLEREQYLSVTSQLSRLSQREIEVPWGVE